MNETSLNATTASSQALNTAQETTNNPLEEAISLLIAWNLPQLCEKFREQEVCINAFQCLTERDIIELVPKIGPRAIFCARLKEWLRITKHIANEKQHNSPRENFTDLLGAVKLEVRESEANWINDVDELQRDPSPIVVEKNDQIAMDANLSNIANLSQAQMQVNSVNTQVFVNVRDILTNNFYGLKAIEYYDNHQTLDAVQRKKVVEIIISTVMEQHVVMSSQCFTDLAQQVISLFPNECAEAYYTPRTGLTCPKGALYNKYLNMGKALRRSGLLEYRVGRRVRHNPIYQK